MHAWALPTCNKSRQPSGLLPLSFVCAAGWHTKESPQFVCALNEAEECISSLLIRIRFFIAQHESTYTLFRTYIAKTRVRLGLVALVAKDFPYELGWPRSGF